MRTVRGETAGGSDASSRWPDRMRTQIRRRTRGHRETIRRALSSPTPPSYSRAARGSKLDRFKDEVHELLRVDPEIESQRIREILVCGLCSFKVG